MLEKQKIELSITPNKLTLTELNFDDLTNEEKSEYDRVMALPKNEFSSITLDNITTYED